MPTSYTRSVKTGKGQRTVYNTSASGKTTRTAVRRTNLGSGQYLTTRYTENQPKSSKPMKTTRTSRSSRSSSGDAGGALALMMLIGLFTGLWFVLKSLYDWATKQKAPM